MKKTTICVLTLLFVNISVSFAQTNQPDRINVQTYNYPPTDPLQNISQEIMRICEYVQNSNHSIKELLEKFVVCKGMQLTERQQKLHLGLKF